VRDLVDTCAFTAGRWVPQAEGEVIEPEPAFGVAGDQIDESPGPDGLGEVSLGTATETGAVPSLVVAGQELGYWLAATLELAANLPRGIASRCGCVAQILAPRDLVEGHDYVAWPHPLQGGWSALAVARKANSMLGLEIREGAALMAETTEDRVGRSVRDQRQRSIRTLVGDDVVARSIAAELDVGLLCHASMMAGSVVGGQQAGNSFRTIPTVPEEPTGRKPAFHSALTHSDDLLSGLIARRSQVVGRRRQDRRWPPSRRRLWDQEAPASALPHRSRLRALKVVAEGRR